MRLIRYWPVHLCRCASPAGKVDEAPRDRSLGESESRPVDTGDDGLEESTSPVSAVSFSCSVNACP